VTDTPTPPAPPQHTLVWIVVAALVHIPKRVVWKAFKRVKANQGAAGVDRQSIAEFDSRGATIVAWPTLDR